MKNSVYFVGGAKGTGKTTLLRKLSDKTGLNVVNTGDFFNQDKRDPSEVKKEIIGYLIKNSPLIADTHYAGFLKGIFSGKFERGLYHSELSQLNDHVNLTLILMYLLFISLQ